MPRRCAVRDEPRRTATPGSSRSATVVTGSPVRPTQAPAWSQLPMCGSASTTPRPAASAARRLSSPSTRTVADDVARCPRSAAGTPRTSTAGRTASPSRLSRAQPASRRLGAEHPAQVASSRSHPAPPRGARPTSAATAGTQPRRPRGSGSRRTTGSPAQARRPHRPGRLSARGTSRGAGPFAPAPACVPSRIRWNDGDGARRRPAATARPPARTARRALEPVADQDERRAGRRARRCRRCAVIPRHSARALT